MKEEKTCFLDRFKTYDGKLALVILFIFYIVSFLSYCGMLHIIECVEHADTSNIYKSYFTPTLFYAVLFIPHFVISSLMITSRTFIHMLSGFRKMILSGFKVTKTKFLRIIRGLLKIS